MNVEIYRQQALQKQNEHRKFLDRLRRRAPKNLDYIVEETHEEVFEEINCLECANCCKTTGPLFTPKDIERIAKHLRMKPSDFEEKYLRIDEDQDSVLKHVPCDFLMEDHYCSIYDVRPKACREYPHTDRKKIYTINKIMLKNTLICPAAFVFVEKMQAKVDEKK